MGTTPKPPRPGAGADRFKPGNTYQNYGRHVPSRQKIINELRKLLIKIDRYVEQRAGDVRWCGKIYDRVAEALKLATEPEAVDPNAKPKI